MVDLRSYWAGDWTQINTSDVLVNERAKNRQQNKEDNNTNTCHGAFIAPQSAHRLLERCCWLLQWFLQILQFVLAERGSNVTVREHCKVHINRCLAHPRIGSHK